MVEVLNLLLGGLVPYKLDGRYICLWVWPWQAMPMTMADKPLCFLLPHLSSMHEYSLENDGAVQSSNLPLWVLIQKYFCI